MKTGLVVEFVSDQNILVKFYYLLLSIMKFYCQKIVFLGYTTCCILPNLLVQINMRLVSDRETNLSNFLLLKDLVMK